MNRQDLQKKLQDTREAIFVAIATMDSQKKELEQVCASSPEAKKRALAIHTQFMETKSRLATLHALQDVEHGWFVGKDLYPKMTFFVYAF